MTAAIDTRLIDRAAACDPAAVADLLARLRPDVVRYCRARLGQHDSSWQNADDVAQEVCLALLSALPRYRADGGEPFGAWVYAIAKAKIADAWRAAGRDSRLVAASSLADAPDQRPGPEQETLRAETVTRLGRLLAKLPPVQREIIVLRIAVGLSAEQVGRALGMTAPAVRVAQSRALGRLRTLAVAGNSLDGTAG